LLAIWLAWRETDDKKQMTTRAIIMRGALFGVVMALATSTRPEGVMLAVILGGMMLLARPHPHLRQTILWGIGA
ncbi:MAG TPA: hypothetical protein PLZ51_16135, partial [Aggregatilineales bacterium]|nr:hypothetical protein [Aggregatilineales bacterium]